MERNKMLRLKKRAELNVALVIQNFKSETGLIVSEVKAICDEIHSGSGRISTDAKVSISAIL